VLDNSCTIWLFHYSVRLECPTDPRISRTRKRKTPEPCIIGAVSSLTNLPTSTKSIDGPNRGHGNHHGRVAASCIARVRVADVEIIACSFALAALVVWFEIGVWRTLGGPTPADDVDLTLMIREGQTGQVKRPPHRPRPGMSRGPRRQRPRTPHEIGGVGGGLYHTLGALARRTAPSIGGGRRVGATCPMGHL
jgi:hypothetical protein